MCLQARWSLLLDADLRGLVDGGSFAVKLAAIAVRMRPTLVASSARGDRSLTLVPATAV